ncbi:hypothetical protein SAMN02745823_00791 [Sporobacter termitidis DSM 10068]|uniref:Uncharacterized protein n=1 Tax=Sporobacter termitidis DSM 10068 TaxID=1123282 RepID=A0A1M5VEL1_9FIRM|nr:hypothetical protein [Sporobacter termitidis]SHH73687.1 hypothetical protein SAMN02745823_00791 [Sporobacter termitidis DSM 10068]
MTNEELLDQVSRLIETQTVKINLMIENAVTKRIDSLFDGYKLTHEKQWELEREVEDLKKRVEHLEVKAG